MKKRVRYISIFLVLILSVSVMVGCDSKEKNEKAIKEALVKELDSIKNQDEKLMKQYEETVGVDEMEAMGIDPEEFMSTYLDGFDYSIEEVAVEDEKATAQVVLKCKSFEDYQTSLEEAATDIFSDMEALSQMTEEELQLKLGEVIMGTIEDLEVKETEPIDLEYELDGDIWKPATDSETKIANALLGT